MDGMAHTEQCTALIEECAQQHITSALFSLHDRENMTFVFKLTGSRERTYSTENRTSHLSDC